MIKTHVSMMKTHAFMMKPWMGIKVMEPLKTSVFRGFLTLWRKSFYSNCLYYNKLAIFSETLWEPNRGFQRFPLFRRK
jgi:hypothetical protein